jgi:hypothetical protein
MKPQTYFRLALLSPYALWGICALALFLLQSILETPEAWNIALMPITFYVIGILLWFIPYTLLAVGLWIWSRSRSTPALYRMALIAPILLLVLMLAEIVLVSLPVDSMAELTEELIGQSALVGGFSLVFGYLCVGVALGVFKVLQARKLIAKETPPSILGE